MSSRAGARRGKANSFTRSVPSRVEEVEGVCALARDLLAGAGLEKRQFDVDLLLREFMTNAVIHGNGSDRKKRVGVDFRIGPKWIVLHITDEGPGFRWRTKSRIPPDERAASGRGLAIGALYAHRTRYNNAGNQVTLWIGKIKEKESQGL